MLGGNEAEKTMEMWEKSRKPRKVPADMDSISVPRSTLEGIISEDMKCPICLGTIDVTLTVTTCLHRFCTECLERSLRVNLGPKDHHDCPACRAKMASRRASKRDTRFDYLTTLFSVSTGRKPQSALDAVVDSIVVDEEDEVSPRNKRSQPAPDSYEDEDEEDFDFSQYQQAHESKVEQFRKRQRLLVANRGPLPAYTPSAPVTHTNSSSSKNKSRSSSSKARPEPVGPRVCLSLFPSFEVSVRSPLPHALSLTMPPSPCRAVDPRPSCPSACPSSRCLR